MGPAASKGLARAVLILATGLFVLGRSPSSPARQSSPIVELGRQLFFDARLSSDNSMSCASCHIPGKAYTDGRTLARGHRGKRLARNTPTLLNLREYSSYFWDGRSSSLEDQIVEVMQNPDEMNMSAADLVGKLSAIPEYTSRFRKIFGTGITLGAITRAVVAFEETLISRRAPFDRYLMGQKKALSASAQRGLQLFRNKAKCAFCHKGFAFTDSNFHNLGVPPQAGFNGRRNALVLDEGRFNVTHNPTDRGAFKTPTLRNIAQTAPYMHNGALGTLEEVIEFYDRGGGKNPNLDVQMEPLHLTAQEKKDLLAFLKSLTGRYTVAVRPVLPGE